MNFYSLHIGDYASDTAHLSWQEDLVYRRLLDLYYLREQPISADLKALCRLLRAREPELEAAVQTVLEEFFTLTPEGWRHKRCDAEIALYLGKREGAVRNAQRRWGPGEVKPGDAKPGDAKQADALEGPSPFKGEDRKGMGFDMPPHPPGNAKPMPPHSSGNATAMPPHDSSNAIALPPHHVGIATNTNPNPNPITNPTPTQTPAREMAQATAAGDACRQMRALGIRGVNPSHPDLLALLAAGETPQNFADLAREIVERHPAKPMSYLLTVMRNRRSEQHAMPARAPAHRTDTQAKPRNARPAVEPL